MNHLKQIAAKLPEYEIDAMLLSSAPGEFYGVGFHGEGYVVVTANECRYFTDSRYIEAAEKTVTGASITMTDRGHSYPALIRKSINELGIRKLGFEEGYMTVAEYKRLEGVVSELNVEMVPAQGLVNGLRAAKDQEELDAMVQAQRISERAFDEILKFIKPGVTEKEIAAKLEYDMLRFGAQKMSFDPIVVSGPNGSLPHGVPSDKKVENGEFITMDFGCIYNGYCSDMTRTVALPPPARSSRTPATASTSATATATALALRSTRPPTPTCGTRLSCLWAPPCPPSPASICPAASACASRMWPS